MGFKYHILLTTSCLIVSCNWDDSTGEKVEASKNSWRYTLPYTYVDGYPRVIADAGKTAKDTAEAATETVSVKLAAKPATEIGSVPESKSQPDSIAKQHQPEMEVFTIVEEMPIFKYSDKMPRTATYGNDGKITFLRYININRQYPISAIEQRLEGRVFVAFIVMPDGKVSNVHVTRSIHPLLDKAAMYIIQNMPDWVSGKQRGKPVAVRIATPIHFQLKESGYTPEELQRAKEFEEELNILFPD